MYNNITVSLRKLLSHYIVKIPKPCVFGDRKVIFLHIGLSFHSYQYMSTYDFFCVGHKDFVHT